MSNISNTNESAGGNLTARALREGFFAGLVSLGLFVLFVGLETTQNIRNELVLNQRWGLLAIFVIVAAVGRFLTVAYLRPWMAARKAAAAAKPAVEAEELLQAQLQQDRHCVPADLSFPRHIDLRRAGLAEMGR